MKIPVALFVIHTYNSLLIKILGAEVVIIDGLKGILLSFSMYRADKLTSARSKDVLKSFYQDLVPNELRKSLGEFYTPEWLVEVTLDRINVKNFFNSTIS